MTTDGVRSRSVPLRVPSERDNTASRSRSSHPRALANLARPSRVPNGRVLGVRSESQTRPNLKRLTIFRTLPRRKNRARRSAEMRCSSRSD
ncbi:hypothetical protein C8Q76DRAFT_240507 [Earliella scabrosa]|nr:hypothetical protein C8Q76DRAFT_240507 [Earliella scabrosa]